jgi:lysophospholipase L1-like esterase
VRPVLASIAVAAALGAGVLAAGQVIEPVDTLAFTPPKEKGAATLVEGHEGKAERFEFAEGSSGAFFTSRVHGAPEWDDADGFSFWLKGDGSNGFGGLEFIYDEDYAVRYDYAFSLKNPEWRQVKVAWRDLVPVLPGPHSRRLDPKGENRPSKLSALWIGKWWYWRDYPAHSFALDDLRLEEHLATDQAEYRPPAGPLGRVRAKLEAGKAITIVTMGDSLTDFRHWANRQTNWPTLLKNRLKQKYGSEVTLVNPAIGGTQLLQNLVLIPRWQAEAPEPDLVTVCFGFNDWDGGMRGPAFLEAYRGAVDRIRRATHGKSDVLIMTTLPSIERWTMMEELSEACRKAAKDRNAGLADTDHAFHEAGATDREGLYASDRTHLGAPGHQLVADTVFKALTGE